MVPPDVAAAVVDAFVIEREALLRGGVAGSEIDWNDDAPVEEAECERPLHGGALDQAAAGIGDDELHAFEAAVDQVLAANAKQVEDYRAGKEKAFNSLVGQVMKATQGKANPAQVNAILKRRLGG